MPENYDLFSLPATPLAAGNLVWTSPDGQPITSRIAPQRFKLDRVTLLPAAAVLALTLGGYLLDSAWLLWTAAVPALWLAFQCPARLVQLLLLTIPTFPVIRLIQDSLGAQKVSTKGLFLSADDPIIAALVVAWLWRALGRRSPGRLFPAAILWLMLLYPLVIAANLPRLGSSQALVSALYYLKWLQYALLIVLIPQVIAPAHLGGLLGSLRKLLVAVLVVSTAFAAFETVEALRTGSFSSAARFPRASAFFGTLDPARYGSSEDPVNFGVYAMVAGAIALGLVSGQSRRRRLGPLAASACAGVSILLCASRAPLLAAAAAFWRIHRFRSARLALAVGALVLVVFISALTHPAIWSVTVERFEAILEWTSANESSAVERMTVMLNSPLFELDQYWLSGHGFSAYRFVAEERRGGLIGGVSRSLYNFPLAVWYDAGPIGLALWTLLFAQLDRRLRLIAAGSPWEEARALAFGLRGALWGLAAAAMFSEVPYGWRVMGFFYVCSGICLAADLHARRQASRTAWLWQARFKTGAVLE